MRFVIRILVNALALWVADYFLSGMSLDENIVSVLIVALLFGLINALIRPIVKLLTLPINVMTLGLFTLVINAAMLMLTDWITDLLTLDGGFFDRFLTALVGAIIISIVSLLASWFLPDNKH